jgi:hypothetical protein
VRVVVKIHHRTFTPRKTALVDLLKWYGFNTIKPARRMVICMSHTTHLKVKFVATFFSLSLCKADPERERELFSTSALKSPENESAAALLLWLLSSRARDTHPVPCLPGAPFNME